MPSLHLKFSLQFTSTQMVVIWVGEVLTVTVENVEKLDPSTPQVGI